VVNVSPVLIHVVLVLVLIGVLLWLVNTYIPMAASIKSLLNVIVFVAVLLWVLHVFGFADNINLPAL
jgi:hypothetical protein